MQERLASCGSAWAEGWHMRTRRMLALAAALLLAVVVAGCGSKPNVFVDKGTLTTYPKGTAVEIEVAAPHAGTVYEIKPSKDAVLRDNLGHEYHVLVGDDDLDGRIGGNAFGRNVRSGSLQFPVIDQDATVLSLSFPLYAGSTLTETILLGVTSPREPKWNISAVWARKNGRFVMLSQEAAARLGEIE